MDKEPNWLKNKNLVIKRLREIVRDVFCFISNLFGGMFFFPVRIKHKTGYNSAENNQNYKKYGNFVHYYSPPLSIKYPKNARSEKQSNPTTKFWKDTFSGVINLPIIMTPKTICAKLKKNFDKFSIRFFVNFISKNIIPKIKEFVNPAPYLFRIVNSNIIHKIRCGVKGKIIRTVPILTILVLFFLSGTCMLIYEVVWMRMLSLVFGSSKPSINTVLAAFMTGLAIGAYLFGKIIDKEGRTSAKDDVLAIKIYGVLSGLIGLYALLTPVFFKVVSQIYVYFNTPSLAIKFFLSFIVLLIPALMMGGLLPVVSKLFIRTSESAGRSVGAGLFAQLYGIHTLGGAFGAVLTGFLFIEFFGVRETLIIASVINLLIMAVTLTSTSMGLPRPEASGTPGFVNVTNSQIAKSWFPSQWFLIATILISGFTALGYQVLWSRLLSMVLGSSTYAFSIMLGVYLVGLALGSFLYKRVRRIWEPVSGIGLLETLISFYIPLSVVLSGVLSVFCLYFFDHFGIGFIPVLVLQLLVTGTVLIIPTFFFGLLFPYFAEGLFTVASTPKFGGQVGVLCLANVLGTAAGAVIVGFFLSSKIGMWSSFTVLSIMNLLIGGLYLIRTNKKLLVPVAAAVLLAGLFWGKPDIRHLNAGVIVKVNNYLSMKHFIPDKLNSKTARSFFFDYKTLFYREGINFAVSVQQRPQNLSLTIDGKPDASIGSFDMMQQLLLGHLPCLLHTEPKTAVVIGLASGVTLGAVQKHNLVNIECVEIEPAMVEAQEFFTKYNNNCLKDKRTALILEDARNYLMRTKNRYDLIICGPSNLWIEGQVNLFTKEFFSLCKEGLNPDGLTAHWVHLYGIKLNDLQTVIKTFQSVFPYITLWETNSLGDIIMLGSMSPQRINYERIVERIKADILYSDMAYLKINSGESFLAGFIMGDKSNDFAKSGKINSDYYPILEFSAMKNLYSVKLAGDNHEKLLEYYEAPTDYLRTSKPPLLKVIDGQIKRGFLSNAEFTVRYLLKENPEDKRLHNLLGYVYLSGKKVSQAEEQFKKALAIDEKYTAALTNLSQVCWLKGQTEASLRYAFRAVEVGGKQLDEAYNNLGMIYWKMRKLDSAEEMFRKAVKKNPGNEIARNNLARLLRAENRN